MTSLLEFNMRDITYGLCLEADSDSVSLGWIPQFWCWSLAHTLRSQPLVCTGTFFEWLRKLILVSSDHSVGDHWTFRKGDCDGNLGTTFWALTIPGECCWGYLSGKIFITEDAVVLWKFMPLFMSDHTLRHNLLTASMRLRGKKAASDKVFCCVEKHLIRKSTSYFGPLSAQTQINGFSPVLFSFLIKEVLVNHRKMGRPFLFWL